MILKHAVSTDIGLRRNHNEDAYEIAEDANLYVIADGIGGHAAGEIASEMAVKLIIQFIRESLQDDSMTWPLGLDWRLSADANRILSAVRLANESIFFTAAEQDNLRGMGTTLVLAFFRFNEVYIAHVGDSRAYRSRNGKIAQITKDHSLLEDEVYGKLISNDYSGNYGLKNVITRALGIMKEVEADIQLLTVESGDRFLLCTDGLTDMLSEGEIGAILKNKKRDLQATCQELVNRANANGGMDNITAILVDCV
jgi:serine/threonine protein phosphatase PrpC